MNQDALGAMAQTVAHILEMRTRVSGGAKKSYDELFDLACRKVDEIAPVNVSKEAHEEAVARKLDDLRTYCWHCPVMNKHRDSSGKKRRLFLWEHYMPVMDIQNEILQLGLTPPVERISIILAKTKIVWVLRKEGDKLGNRSRPDPDAAYRYADVVLLYPWEKCQPIECKRHRPRSQAGAVPIEPK